jgi:Tol biopolymer transport system component
MIEEVRIVTPTADTPTPLPPLNEIPAELSGRILFKTTRNGGEETFAFDPNTYQLFRINDARIYPMAQPQQVYSPDGRFVTFVERDPNRLLQIKTRSLEYNTIQQVTAFGPNPMREEPASYDPAWSPRGDLIVFVTNNTGNDEIFTVDIQGTTLTQLTSNHSEWDKHPSWSPDGSQIIFFSNRDVGLRRLWIMNSDGSGQRELSSLLQPPATSSSYEDYNPIWVR